MHVLLVLEKKREKSKYRKFRDRCKSMRLTEEERTKQTDSRNTFNYSYSIAKGNEKIRRTCTSISRARAEEQLR